jgi:peptidoglycan hydrolase-like protein with peptidoglycan-binding domain
MCKDFTADGIFGELSAAAASAFQSSISLPSTGILDSNTAQRLLDLHSADNYKDSG